MRVQKFLSAPATTFSPRVIFWFSLNIIFTAVCGIQVLHKSFSGQYVIQDDAHVYLLWMQRLIDPGLLPHDLIADYYQSVTPSGYATLYRVMSAIGIHPILFSKILPIVLGLVATGYCFGLCMQLLPVPTASFLATLLLNQSMWLQDDLISATPRAFIYPLFLACLYYLVRRSLLPYLLATALLGLFYPPFILILAVVMILRLWRWEGGLPRSLSRSNSLFCLSGLGIAFLVMLPYLLHSSEFGPTVTAAEARTWPEYMVKGRVPFFTSNLWRYWFNGAHSGIRLSLNPPMLGTGLFLPLLLRYPSRFPLAQRVTSEVTLLLQILLASLGWFFASHAVLFKLYLPSRYTQHSLRMVMSLAAGIALVILLDAIWQWAQDSRRQARQVLALTTTVLIGATIFLYPSLVWKSSFPRTSSYFVGAAPSLYQFFQKQPKDIRIASLLEMANDIPIFSQRSILVSRKYADPFHVGYYRQIRQRATDLIRAQYTQDLAEVQNIIRKYQIDFWLLDRNSFAPEEITKNSWLQQYQPVTAEAIQNLQQGNVPVLSKLTKSCSVFEVSEWVVLKASCIIHGILSK